jgi:Trk K+ transport system NAD-binding subunit
MLKSIAAIVTTLRTRRSKRNLHILFRFLVTLVGLIFVYSVLFHVLMAREGQEHSWFTGFYWTLTVMSTLGFGDITFHSDLGRAFSVFVLTSGVVFLLIVLPFTFIEFFYGPWMQAQAAARAPTEIAPEVSHHVLLTNHDVLTSALIRRLDQHRIQYSLLVSDVDEALRLHDAGLNVVRGELDDANAWHRAGLERAALVLSTASDFKNTNVTFTVRALSEEMPVITTADDEASVDILRRAGSTNVLRLEELMGQAFAYRTFGRGAQAHVIGRFDKLLIAEANAHRTPLVGKTLRESGLRENAGVSVVGVWERGRFAAPRPETGIRDNTILVLAGQKEHLDRYNQLFCIYNVSPAPVTILGGGRVGQATARELVKQEVDYRIVEKVPDRVRDAKRTIVGDAAKLEVLKQANIDETPTVLVTTRDDDLNIYLTGFCRSLRPDVQVISRATLERSVATLHRAGADIVMSYAGTGASTIMNFLQPHKIVMVAEGLDLFRLPVPAELAGKRIAESGIRERTGCTIVGIGSENTMETVPGPGAKLPEGADILMIGTADSEESFLERWG